MTAGTLCFEERGTIADIRGASNGAHENDDGRRDQRHRSDSAKLTHYEVDEARREPRRFGAPDWTAIRVESSIRVSAIAPQ
jgi:hypothetical protein